MEMILIQRTLGPDEVLTFEGHWNQRDQAGKQVAAGVYQVRGVLDSLAARAAAATPRPELKEPGAELIRAGRAAAARRDLVALVRADLDFHEFIYDASHNPLLAQTVAVHWHHTRMPRRLSSSTINPCRRRICSACSTGWRDTPSQPASCSCVYFRSDGICAEQIASSSAS